MMAGDREVRYASSCECAEPREDPRRRRCSSSKRSKGCRADAWRPPIVRVRGTSRSCRSRPKGRTASSRVTPAARFCASAIPRNSTMRRNPRNRDDRSISRPAVPPPSRPLFRLLPVFPTSTTEFSGFPPASGIQATQCGPRASLCTCESTSGRPYEHRIPVTDQGRARLRKSSKILIAYGKAVLVQFEGLERPKTAERRAI